MADLLIVLGFLIALMSFLFGNKIYFRVQQWLSAGMSGDAASRERKASHQNTDSSPCGDDGCKGEAQKSTTGEGAGLSECIAEIKRARDIAKEVAQHGANDVIDAVAKHCTF